MKKQWKWAASLAFAALALLTLSGCSKDEGNEQKKDDNKKSIGVLQLVEHESLDAAYKGFLAGLKEAGYEKGKNLTIDYQNAQNNQDNLKSMSEKLVKEKPDLLLAIATPAAQSLMNENTNLPMLVTAVTDLQDAKLVKNPKKPEGNVTGTSDMAPVDKQIELLLSIVPDAKKIGIAYNAGETNSKVQAELAKKALKAAGVDVKELTANSTNDVQQVITSLAKDCDGIYIPTDNTLAKAAVTVGEVAKEEKIPVVTGSVEQVENGALATYGISYESLGKQTGLMAGKILDGKAKPSDLPVETAQSLELLVNEDMAKALGIDPASIKAPE